MKTTKCFNQHQILHRYWTSRPLKDANEISSHHMDSLWSIWESGVKSAKDLLRRTQDSHADIYEELCILLAEIEACLNSRRLCALSDDPFKLNNLFPGHFLIGEPITQLPAADFTEVKCYRLSRWQTYQQ